MKKRIYFVTGNIGKLEYANNIIKDFGVEFIQKKLEINEGRETSPKEVVVKKAKQAYKQLKKPLVIEDSGIFISALNGFPKTLIHFAEETIGVEGVIKLMKNHEDRNAEFRSALAYIGPKNKEPVIFEEVDDGFVVANEVRSAPGMVIGGFDKILMPSGGNKANSELSKEDRLERQRARKRDTHWYAFGKWLTKNNL